MTRPKWPIRYRSIVRVSTIGIGENSLGSGCVIRWGKRFIILTARHVVKGAKKVFVRGLRGNVECTVLGGDTDWDIVVLAPNTATTEEDFEASELGTEELTVNEKLVTCGYGDSRSLLACNYGRVLKFVRHTSKREKHWVEISGAARGGDSGGPVFNNQGKLVGILWGTTGTEVCATRCSYMNAVLVYVLGPKPANYVVSRPVVPVRRDSVGASVNVGLFRNGPLCPGGGCSPQPETPPSVPMPMPQQPPQINVQADPRVGDALQGIDGKLDVVIQNTTPPEITEEPEKETNSLVLIGVIASGIIVGVITYFSTQD